MGLNSASSFQPSPHFFSLSLSLSFSLRGTHPPSVAAAAAFFGAFLDFLVIIFASFSTERRPNKRRSAGQKTAPIHAAAAASTCPVSFCSGHGFFLLHQRSFYFALSSGFRRDRFGSENNAINQPDGLEKTLSYPKHKFSVTQLCLTVTTSTLPDFS